MSDTWQRLIEGHPGYGKVFGRELERAPGQLHDGIELEISVCNFSMHSMDSMERQSPRLTYRQRIPVQGGIERLRWEAERMLDEIILAKSKAFSEWERKRKEEKEKRDA